MDGVIAFLNNQQYAILAAMAVGILVKYLPFLKGVSNEGIPFLAALTAWVTNVFGAPEVQAGVLGGVLGGIGGIFVPVIDAAVSKFVHETLLRGLWKAIGLKKPEGVKTPG
jgi:hypothetical protein